MTPGAAALCTALLSAHGHSAAVDDALAQRLCVRVATVALDQGVPVALTIVLAWHESNFNPDAVSPAGARDVLQVMPKNIEAYGGPDQDPVLAGVVVFRRWRRRSHDWTEAVCRYQAGNRCGPRRMDKARRIVGMAERLTKRVARQERAGDA